ncbi:acylneuraminate cytidylyltransferase family protein [Dermatophilaceae bacterium Sec6.4]
MKTLCVIPVRGGSKGVPGKNLREVEGRPLVVWTIEQALAVDGLHVLVSTDDERIAEIARTAGADVPFLRPPELAQDATPTEPVVQHAIAHRVAHGSPPEAVMLLQATSPLRLPGTLDRAMAQFQASGADSLVGVVPFAPFFWWAGDSGAAPRADYEVAARPRRQDLSPLQMRYRETGSLYITRPWVYAEQNNRLGGRVELFVMDEVEGIDIDTEHDLRLAAHELRRIAERGTTSGSVTSDHSSAAGSNQ